MNQSDYTKVRDFTIQAGQKCEDEPTSMNKDEGEDEDMAGSVKNSGIQVFVNYYLKK